MIDKKILGVFNTDPEPENRLSYKGRFLARLVPPEEWEDDITLCGFIPVIFQSETRLARPIFNFGAFTVPTKEWIAANYKKVAVVVELLNEDPGKLAWSGFTFWENSTPVDTKEDYPYNRVLYKDTDWQILIGEKKDNQFLKIEHSDETTFLLDRTKDSESVIIHDSTNKFYFTVNKSLFSILDQFDNSFVFNSDGAVIKDTNGNSISLTPSGITLEDKFGHKYSMGASGSTLDGDYIVLNQFINWLNQSAPTFGMGNLGAPVPIFPSSLATLSSGIIPGQNFISNKV